MTTIHVEPNFSDMPRWARKHPVSNDLWRLWQSSLSGRIAISDATTTEMRRQAVRLANPTYYLEKEAEKLASQLDELDFNHPAAIDLRFKLEQINKRIKELEG